MPTPLLLDDAACPRCASPLVTVDADAADDPTTRRRLRRLDGWLRWVWVVGTLVIVSTLGMVLTLLRDGGDSWTWTKVAWAAVQIAFVVVPFMIGVAKAWHRMHTDRTGRRATCQACGHGWTLP